MVSKRKKPLRKGECEYHECDKTKTILYKCKYCGKYFCKEHLRASLPGQARFHSKSEEDIAFLEEFRKPGGHPCPDYYDYWKAEKERKEGEYRAALERLIESKPLRRKKVVPRFYREPYKESFSSKIISNKGKLIGIVAIVIFAYLLYSMHQSGQLQSMLDDIKNWTNSIESPPESGQPTIPQLGKPYIDISQLELDIHNLVNEKRVLYGLPELEWDNKLSDIARSHSIDMANRDFFDHDNPDGQSPTDRGNAANYYCRKDFGYYYTEGLAENIFQNNLYDSITYVNLIPFYDWKREEEIAASTVSGWMDSPGHRENILTGAFDKEGIGIAISSDDEVLITQDFC